MKREYIVEYLSFRNENSDTINILVINCGSSSIKFQIVESAFIIQNCHNLSRKHNQSFQYDFSRHILRSETRFFFGFIFIIDKYWIVQFKILHIDQTNKVYLFQRHIFLICNKLDNSWVNVSRSEMITNDTTSCTMHTK